MYVYDAFVYNQNNILIRQPLCFSSKHPGKPMTWHFDAQKVTQSVIKASTALFMIYTQPDAGILPLLQKKRCTFINNIRTEHGFTTTIIVVVNPGPPLAIRQGSRPFQFAIRERRQHSVRGTQSSRTYHRVSQLWGCDRCMCFCK